MKWISRGVFLCAFAYTNVGHLKDEALSVCLKIKVIHIGRMTNTGKKHKKLTSYNINFNNPNSRQLYYVTWISKHDTQQCFNFIIITRFKSSGLLHHAVWWFKGLQCVHLQGQAVHEECSWTAWPWRWRHCSPMKQQ